MKTLINVLSEPMAVSLGWTLLHALWQGFAMVMPAALLMYFFRHKSSQLRYNVGVGALLGQVILSVITFIGYYHPLLPAAPLAAKTTLTTVASAPVLWPMVSRPLPWYVQVQHFLDSHLTEIVLCWLIGVAVFLVRLVGGWLYVQRLKTTAVKPADAYWQHNLARLSSRLALRQPVRVMESMQVLVPMVVGALKPVILLPVGLATGLTMREAEAILAHELAHVKRFDYAVNLLQSVIEVVFFFHPALWWLSERVREERENCCDDLAILACGDARSLAQALARVEEFSQTPVLAMALASRKKLLLNRVRRMLGVSARPVVSNGHLLMLTLATLLLGTASVYAMQEKEQPKPKLTKKQAPPTRRMKTADGTEFGLTDNKKVDYVVWKGQKLPARRVASLQRQLDQVQAGQLSLDDVAQPDRDILLTIIETNQGFDKGMTALETGLAHMDYESLTASALKNIPLSPDGTVEGLARVNYNRIINRAMMAIDTVINPAHSTFDTQVIKAGSPGVFLDPGADHQRAFHQHQLDSLSQQIAQRSLQMQAIQLQMEKLRFPVEEVQRQNEVLNWRKNKLMEQRNSLIEKHQKLLYNDGKQKLSQAEVEKQLAALEPEIKRLEGSMEALNGQMEQSNVKQEELKKPMEQLNRQAEQLAEQIDKLSDQIGRQSDGLTRLRPELPEPPEAMEIHGTYNMGQDHLELHGTVKTPRPPHPPRAPRAVTIPKPVPTPKAAIAPVPAVAPKPGVAPTPAIPPKN